MKIAIPTEKIKEFSLGHRKMLVFTSLGVLIVVIIIGGYFALNPVANEEARTAGEQKLRELDITFDKTTLIELREELAPTQVSGASGRNPFQPY